MNVQRRTALCLFALLAGAVHAQEVAPAPAVPAPAPDPEPEPEQVKIKRALTSVPSMNALSAPPRSAAERQASKADESLLCQDTATSVELTAGEQEQRAVLSACFNTVGGLALKTRLSTPWQNDADNELADLDGLANAARIDVEAGVRFDNAAWDVDTSILGAYGIEDFDVLALDLSERSVDRDVWRLGASLGFSRSFTTIEAAQAIVVSYRREHGFANDPDDEVSVCIPADGGGERCKQGFLASPQAADRSLASLEYRLAGKKIGFQLKGTYDFEEDIYGVELPVYLTKHEGKFNGGVKFGWREDTNDFTVAVFIGAPLSL